MRWLKHLTRARQDDKVTALIGDCGLEGYGFWWVLCEVVGESIGNDDCCELTHPLPMWVHLLYSHHHRVRKYLGKLQVIGLCEWSETGDRITVKIPNLLKYRDEYSSRIGRESGESRESVPSKKEKQKESREADTKPPEPPAAQAASKKKPLNRSKQDPAFTEFQERTFNAAWSANWSSESKRAGKWAWFDRVKDGDRDAVEKIMAAIAEHKPVIQARAQRNGSTMIFFASWLNQNRDQERLVVPLLANQPRAPVESYDPFNPPIRQFVPPEPPED